MYVVEPLSPEHIHPHREIAASTLARPTARVKHRPALAGLVRLHRQRLIRSLIVGVAAAAATVMVFVLGPGTASSNEGDSLSPDSPVAAGSERANDDGDVVSPAPDAAGSATLPVHSRILALDRDHLRLPVAVDDNVELLGLTPTIEAMQVEVVAQHATVFGLTEDAVLVLVSASEARRAAEVEAVGSLVVLGLGGPTSDSVRP